MLTRTLTLIACAGLAGGCFSPEVGPDADTDAATSGDASSSSGGSETAGPTGSPTTDTPTTTDPTGDTETTADPTTDDPTTTDPTGDTETTTDPTTGGEDPYCGDGNVDPGEDCDDGLDNNGLDQSCLPDCNLNVCGDGNLGPDEFCDDGADDNVLEAGACAPDCSTVIEEKVIRGSAITAGGNYQPNPVGHADALCQTGYRALFAVPGVRQATANTPYEADDPIDWPISPFTAYVRQDGTPIWTTDAAPLLGVRNGSPEPLVNSVVEPCVVDPDNNVFCFPFVRPTGLNNDWTPALSDICNGWSSNSEGQTLDYGDGESTTEFLQGSSTTCSTGTGKFGVPGSWPTFYCVEQ